MPSTAPTWRRRFGRSCRSCSTGRAHSAGCHRRGEAPKPPHSGVTRGLCGVLHAQSCLREQVPERPDMARLRLLLALFLDCGRHNVRRLRDQRILRAPHDARPIDDRAWRRTDASTHGETAAERFGCRNRPGWRRRRTVGEASGEAEGRRQDGPRHQAEAIDYRPCPWARDKRPQAATAQWPWNLFGI